MLLNPIASSSRLLQECPSVLSVYHTRELCIWTAGLDRYADLQCTAVGLGQFTTIDRDLHPPGKGQLWWESFGPL